MIAQIILLPPAGVIGQSPRLSKSIIPSLSNFHFRFIIFFSVDFAGQLMPYLLVLSPPLTMEMVLLGFLKD
jgi:hypothetical protein